MMTARTSLSTTICCVIVWIVSSQLHLLSGDSGRHATTDCAASLSKPNPNGAGWALSWSKKPTSCSTQVFPDHVLVWHFATDIHGAAKETVPRNPWGAGAFAMPECSMLTFMRSRMRNGGGGCEDVDVRSDADVRRSTSMTDGCMPSAQRLMLEMRFGCGDACGTYEKSEMSGKGA